MHIPYVLETSQTASGPHVWHGQYTRHVCSSDVEAHDTRTGNEAGLTDKGLQEAAKLPLPPGNALELVDDRGNEMVVPQEIKKEEHPETAQTGSSRPH